jgi:hydrogenase nickel incorporation protein HypB
MSNERKIIEINSAVLGKNDEIANENRRAFQQQRLLVLNLLSSPGSGKTTLLERTLKELGAKYHIGVIVGDLATERDAERLKKEGKNVAAITTGRTCHLDASMVRAAYHRLSLEGLSLLFIENVGNLICPASFDLGEDSRIVLLSVTEGEDKPLKYPVIFRLADLVIITKIDIAPALGCNLNELNANIRQVAPGADIISLSARSGEGFTQWLSYLGHRLVHK